MDTNQYTIMKEMADFLRGKTIIESIMLYGNDLKLDSLNEIKYPFRIISEKQIIIDTPFNFMDYVTWDNVTSLKDILNNTSLESSTLMARQLFAEQDESFGISLDTAGVKFLKRKNVEDSLFLDLERFLDSKNIPYEVE